MLFKKNQAKKYIHKPPEIKNILYSGNWEEILIKFNPIKADIYSLGIVLLQYKLKQLNTDGQYLFKMLEDSNTRLCELI